MAAPARPRTGPALLEHLGALDEPARAALRRLASPPLMNHAGLQVGHIAMAPGWPAILTAGVDEVGRGPLAGPVVVAAVILRRPLLGLADSKQLAAPSASD